MDDTRRDRLRSEPGGAKSSERLSEISLPVAIKDYQSAAVTGLDLRQGRSGAEIWKGKTVEPDNRSAGLAALSICESLLLSLTDNAIIGADESRVILEDALTAHRDAVPHGKDVDLHLGAAAAIELIMCGGNAVRRR